MITAAALDRIACAIVDLRQEMARAGLVPTVRILVRKEDQEALTKALADSGSGWASRAGPEGGLRIADAVITIGG